MPVVLLKATHSPQSSPPGGTNQAGSSPGFDLPSDPGVYNERYIALALYD